jgi:hypothetical protein
VFHPLSVVVKAAFHVRDSAAGEMRNSTTDPCLVRIWDRLSMRSRLLVLRIMSYSKYFPPFVTA